MCVLGNLSKVDLMLFLGKICIKKFAQFSLFVHETSDGLYRQYNSGEVFKNGQHVKLKRCDRFCAKKGLALTITGSNEAQFKTLSALSADTAD